MEIILTSLLAYLINLAAGFRLEDLSEKRLEKVMQALEKEGRRKRAATSVKSLRELLDRIGGDVGKLMGELGVSDPAERSLFQLLSDPLFRNDLVEWLLYWDMRQGREAGKRLESQMAETLKRAGAEAARIEEFRNNFFNMVDNVVFEDGKLARWRHHLGLVAIREDQDEILRRMRENDGEYEPERLQEALDHYRDVMLNVCDIVDLAGLPEDDRHLAMQNFLLRQLYIPLRVEVEPEAKEKAEEDIFERWEAEREASRRTFGRFPEEVDDSEDNEKRDDRVSVGELMTSSTRAVVLGDPGSGKTTLSRWFATAFLLRLKQDPELAELPDVASLPDTDLVPIMIRCRELPGDAHCRPFEEILEHIMGVNEVKKNMRGPLVALCHRRLDEGSALLMIDGLDEIPDPMLRARFCRRIETLAAIYGKTPILVTSRIFGYREMRFRIGRGFRHAKISDLNNDEMDEFARRWSAATEPENRRERVAKELSQSIHSSERIENLAGNPMLLTTLALVYRKIGRLPQRRADLYREALQVLLNWRGEIDERLDWNEAVPQLEYVAYAMCEDGVQRLPKSRVLDLLEEMRDKYRKRLRDIEKRTSTDFLALLESRSSLLVEAGHQRIDGREEPVYEFRHLTFQEYLAGLALVDGRFPGHRKGVRLPDRVAPLAGIIDRDGEGASVVESWREPLRLCLASCNDDDVDDAMLAVLNQAEGEDPDKISRPRAIMAALCLADEPHVSEDVAGEVIRVLASQVGEDDGRGPVITLLDAAAIELSRSIWSGDFSRALAEEFCKRTSESRVNPGGLCGMVSGAAIEKMEESPAWLFNMVEALSDNDDVRVVEAALTLMELSYWGEINAAPAQIIASLLAHLERSPHISHAAAWALGWLSEGIEHSEDGTWEPSGEQIERLKQFCENPQSDKEAVRWSLKVLGRSRDERVIETFRSRLADENRSVRSSAAEGLVRIYNLETIQKLLICQDHDGVGPYLDPKKPITADRVAEAANSLNLSEAEIHRNYEELAPKFMLSIEWKHGPS